MWTYYPDLLERPVPRYTSYPTAAEFHDRVGAASMEAALAGVERDQPMSLYVHIPYCEKICWYCGCNTGAANKGQRLAAYLEALEAEIALVAARLDGRGRVQRIAFGGGSPNAIAPGDFLRLVDLLHARFSSRDALLSVELDPRSLTPEWIGALAVAGVSRASLGVQTFSPSIQAAIGRVQPADAIGAAVDGLCGAGVGSINFDLMYGLPGQSAAELQDTLDRTVSLRPERIALFGYAHVPHLLPRQRRIDGGLLPGAAERFAQAALGHERLVACGYVPVGFDHFALPGDSLAIAARSGGLRRNFQGFTDDESEVLIGFGASAISSFPGLFAQNEKNSGRYRMLVSSGRLPANRGTLRTDEDRRRARIIEGLLCIGRADISSLCLGQTIGRMAAFRARGLVRIDRGTLRITPEGLPYSRAIAAMFDSYRQPDQRRFSSAI